MKASFVLIGTLLAGSLINASGQVAFSGSYLQTFDSMGSSGTAAPSGWAVYSMAGSHDTFAPADSTTAGTTPSMTAGALSSSSSLTVATSPSTQKSSGGYNLGLSSSASDRALGSSPSGNAATVLQLSLSNQTGQSIDAIGLSYDIRTFTTTTNNNTSYNSSPYKGVEEFPGYRLFYSLDGTTWTNVSSLNPTLSGTSGVVVPNSIGVTSVTLSTIALNSVWAAGTTLRLAWLDDNAQSPSPDQILGLDNVAVIPEPSAYALTLGGAALGWVLLLRRKKPAAR